MSTDINDIADIKRLVDTFYHRAGEDDLLGPIFSQIRDSGRHKESLYIYWANTLLSQPSVDEHVFPQHIEAMFTTKHFIRWLTIFLDTINSLFAGEVAERAKVMVIKKSEEFQSGLELIRF